MTVRNWRQTKLDFEPSKRFRKGNNFWKFHHRMESNWHEIPHIQNNLILFSEDGSLIVFFCLWRTTSEITFLLMNCEQNYFLIWYHSKLQDDWSIIIFLVQKTITNSDLSHYHLSLKLKFNVLGDDVVPFIVGGEGGVTINHWFPSSSEE